MRDSHRLRGVDGRDKPGHDEPIKNGALTKASVSKATRIDDVLGMLRYEGLAKSVEEMDASVLAEASRRKALREY